VIILAPHTGVVGRGNVKRLAPAAADRFGMRFGTVKGAAKAGNFSFGLPKHLSLLAFENFRTAEPLGLLYLLLFG
jgi:hypothetical protein